MNITEFLEARIAEDERRARYVEEYGDTGGMFTPTRVLAECAAKRAVLAMNETYASAAHERVGIAAFGARCGQEVTGDILRFHATVYKNHPDYDPDWAL